MTPREYIDEVVRPNLADLSQEFGSIRAALNAIHSIDALAARVYHAAGGSDATGARDDSAFRGQLAATNPEFALARDLAKAVKHVALTSPRNNPPVVSNASSVETKALGWGVARYGEGRWGSPPQVTVTTDLGKVRVVETVLKNALAFLEEEMARHGL